MTRTKSLFTRPPNPTFFRVSRHGAVAAAVLVFGLGLWHFNWHGERMGGGLCFLSIPNGPPVCGPGTTYYPPAYLAFVRLAQALVGFNYPRVIYIQASFVLLAALYVGALARRVGMGEASYLPAVLFLLLPGTTLAARNLETEMPLLLILPAFAYHLAASAGFRDRKHSFLAGAWAGLGLLTKWTFPAYVVGYALVAGASMFFPAPCPSPSQREWPSAGQWWNAALAMLVAIAACGWWYVGVFDRDLWIATTRNHPARLTYSYGLSLADYLGYVGQMAGLPAVIWIVLGLAFTRRRGRVFLALVFGIALPLLVLAVPVHNEPRYAYPFAPAAALAFALAATDPRRPGRRRLGAAVAIGASALFYFLSPDAWAALSPSPCTMGPGHLARFSNDPILDRQSVADRLARVAPELKNRPANVGVHPLWYNFHVRPEILTYEIARRDMARRFRAPFYWEYAYGEWRDELRRGGFDIVLLDCGPSGDCPATDREMVDDLVNKAGSYRFVNQRSGRVAPAFTWDDILSDLDRLHREFRQAAVFDFGDCTRAAVWIKRSYEGREEKGTSPE